MSAVLEANVFVVNPALVYTCLLGPLQTRLELRGKVNNGKPRHWDLSLTDLERNDSRCSKVREPTGILAKRQLVPEPYHVLLRSLHFPICSFFGNLQEGVLRSN